MNFWHQFMGQFGPSAGNEGQPYRFAPMQANTGGGLPAMAQGFPSAQMSGGLPPMQGGMVAGTGGYDAPHAMPSVNTGGGLPPQAMGHGYGHQGGNGLARMFRGFSPYGRQYMR